MRKLCFLLFFWLYFSQTLIPLSGNTGEDFPEDITDPVEILPGQKLSRASFFRNGYDFILCRGKNFQDEPPGQPVFLENKSAGAWNNETIEDLLKSEGNKKEIQKAHDRLKRAVDRDPQFLAYVYNYGRILQLMERHEEAYEYFIRASSLLPELSSSQVNAGISLSKTAKKHSAANHFKLAFKINRLDTKAILALGNFYLNEKSYEKSEYYFRYLLKEYPGFPDAVAGLAGLYFAKSDMKNARKYYDSIDIEDESGKEFPHSPLIFSHRAAFYEYIGEHEKSISDLKTLMNYRSVLFLYGVDASYLERKIKE